MEVCAKLESFLEEHELNNIPEIAKRKITDHFLVFEQLVTDIRNEKLELNAVLERQQFEFEKEIASSQQQLVDSTESCTKLKSQITELEQNLSSVQKQWRDLQKLHDSSMLEFQSAKRENELLNQEKKNLAEQLEKRRGEIEKLNVDVKSLLDQITTANEARFEAIAASEEAKMKESNLQHQVTRLEQEKELLNRQIADLNAELTQKNHEIHTLKREKSNNILDLKTQLENRADEIHLLQKKLDCFKENLEEKDNRIDALAERIRQLNQSHSKAEEQFNLEITAQTKLIDLHKKASEDNQKRVEELMRAFEEAQKLLKDSNEAYEEIERHCQNVENRCKEQLNEKQSELVLLQEELQKTKDFAHGLNKDSIEKIFPVAAATSKVLHSGMTLTELYVEYRHLQEELQQQKDSNSNLTQELKQILTEIEEKTPLINQKMLEYERSKETIACLKSQLANALVDYEKMLTERNDAKRISNLAERENSRLKTQVLDLNRQVQVLLKEVEEARGGHIHHDSSKMHDDDIVTSSDDVTADKVISRHLVTFRNIEEIQSKNQKLLAVIRDLSQQHEEMEKKLSSELNAKFQKDIEALSSQLEDLQQKRNKQSEMLETIIRQRDMYRVLLTSQGISESLLGQPDGSLSVLQNSSKLSPSDPRLKEAKTAMNQLQAEFNNYKKEKNENERMLNEQLDKMRSTVSDLKIQNAKLSSQCEYSEEREKMLQMNLDTFKKECMSLKEKNGQHSNMIIQHQQTINSLRQDLMFSQEKIAKYEVSVENLKSERDLLKNVETRLMQEKESIMKEQQHQSRMMANLRAVQNNLERIESETKRNLQYQVEKLEKENNILKTKIDNANEEYRSAVKIWEKQNKELQSKIDVEIEKNRKLHEDLVDAYSQVHALNQELINAKAQIATTPEKTNVESSKTPQKIQSAINTAATEMKQLKEQLNESNMKLKSVQEKLDISTKSAEQYLNMCRDLELRVKEQDEINKHLQDTMDSTLNSSKEAQLSLEKNLENMEKTNRELIEENMKLAENSGSQVTELQLKVSELLKSIEDYQTQAEVAKQTAEQARNDCQNQLKLMQDVQEKYERELMLHAQDMQTMTALKEEHMNCSSKFQKLTEEANISVQALAESRESWSRQETILTKEAEALKQRLKDLEECNHNLHEQLDLMGTQMAALQSKNWNETPYASIQSDLKDTQHLLQVIQFIKKEKEIACTEFDVAQSENVRLNLKVEQLSNELTETKAELRDIMGNFQAKATTEAQHAELLKKVEMMNLLTESNNLLRMEKESLSASKSKLDDQIQELEAKLQPLIEKEKEMSQQNDILAVENNALRLEVKSWQSRTNQLLEQSHRIGPQEYKNLMKEIEELKSQKERLTEELQRKQAEVSQITTNTSSLKKEIENLKKTLNQKSQDLTKMNEDVANHQKTMLQIKKIGRKYKTQYDELKVKYDDLEVKSNAINSTNQEQSFQEIQKKLEESEKCMVELKNEVEKEKELASMAKQAQTKSTEKEERAMKVLSQFRQKYAQINNQKDNLSEENKKLIKEVEDLKAQISELLMSQEENNQSKTHYDVTITRLEKELRMEKELRVSEREFLEKRYDELYVKMAQQKQKIKPSIGIVERAGGSSSEPLTANIKPLTSPSTSGVSPSLRVPPHPHAATTVSRPTPTASIRPMAIGTASSSTPSQTRMAAVLPTTATPPHSEEDPIFVASSPSISVSHPVQPLVQPTPATATVAPTTMAVTVSPVISDVTGSEIDESTNREEQHSAESHQALVIGISTVPSPATALVTPRMDVPDVTSVEVVTADSPAPTTSVIVSPPATQVVAPTVKRPREESPGVDTQEGSLKRVRMVSEGSQTNQQLPSTPNVSSASNVAVVSAAQVIPRKQSLETSLATETHLTVPNVLVDSKDTPVAIISSSVPSTSSTVDESVVPTSETAEAEILDEDEKDEQNIDWEPQDDTKIDEDYETEGMEEDVVIIGENEELDEDVEHMQGIDAKSPDDEDMSEEPHEEEMADQPNSSTADIDILDSTSDIQMDADSGSLQTAPPSQCMAPPAFPPTLEVANRSDGPPIIEAIIGVTTSSTSQQSSVTTGPPRLDRQPPVSRQHLTPFTIPGQGSNFEEGDDSIVPSTPTLYVPRRPDGFAEAVSSPHVPQVRFLFSSSDSSPTQQSYAHSQLASQGALGVDDTRMDLFDDGSNRTVPSTPLQVSPPSEVPVPEVPESVLETTPISEMAAGIEIRVDLVEEPAVSNAQTITSKESADSVVSISATEIEVDSSKEKVQGEKIGEKPETVPDENTAVDVAKASSSTETRNTEETSKTTDVQEESSNKDGPSQVPQRKPIVWSQDKSEPKSTSDTVSSDSVQTPSVTTVRGRVRARRARYAAAAAYSRGRGELAWGSRRGRSSRRRGGIY